MPAYDNEGATISMEDVRAPEAPITISTIEEELIARRHKMFKTQKSTVASRLVVLALNFSSKIFDASLLYLKYKFGGFFYMDHVMMVSVCGRTVRNGVVSD